MVGREPAPSLARSLACCIAWNLVIFGALRLLLVAAELRFTMGGW